jgi:hypothetical protein
MIEQDDPFTGCWRLNAQISKLSSPPESWLQEVVATPETISVREEIIRPDGAVTVLALQAKFDGMEYRVEGSPAVETMAYTRTDRYTILGTGRKQGTVALTGDCDGRSHKTLPDFGVSSPPWRSGPNLRSCML